HVMSSGQVAFKTNGDGFRGDASNKINRACLTPATLYSNYIQKQIDLRDWNVRANVSTTGTISATSTSLAVASATNFQIGDFVVVEIGAESGAGQPGPRGVGGNYPSQRYTSTASMNADTGQVNNLMAWVDDGVNGFMYQNYATNTVSSYTYDSGTG